MIVRVDALNAETFLVFRSQFLRARLPHTQVTEEVTRTMPHGQCTAILQSDGGYALFHPGDWQGQPVLWIDELYLQPQARKQGHLQELVEWIRTYCEYNGIPAVMGMAYSLEEGLPLKKHTGVFPVAQILRIAVADLSYRLTPQQPVSPAATGTTQPLPVTPHQRKRQRKAERQRERDVERVDRAMPAESNGTVLQHRSGVVLPLPDDPNRM
jgi:hypothetical protein